MPPPVTLAIEGKATEAMPDWASAAEAVTRKVPPLAPGR